MACATSIGICLVDSTIIPYNNREPAGIHP
jgi:hypothetical protein